MKRHFIIEKKGRKKNLNDGRRYELKLRWSQQRKTKLCFSNYYLPPIPVRKRLHSCTVHILIFT